MNFMNAVKAANIVSSLILVGAFGASVYHLPDLWAVDLLKMLVMGAAGWLMVKEARTPKE